MSDLAREEEPLGCNVLYCTLYSVLYCTLYCTVLSDLAREEERDERERPDADDVRGGHRLAPALGEAMDLLHVDEPHLRPGAGQQVRAWFGSGSG